MTETSAPTQPLLDVVGLNVRLAGREVLCGVDLRLDAGECVAVVGASGAGKSVLARTLVGLAHDGAARVEVSARRWSVGRGERRREVSSAGERTWRRLRGREIGLVLQDALGSLDPLRTVGAEVAETLRLSPRDPLVLEALRRAGLPLAGEIAALRPEQLSGGMRQRALIASAIVADPPLLVLDEPTTALDATVAAGVLELLRELRAAGTALLLVTHDLGAAWRVADRVVVLSEGRVVEEGGTTALLASPRTPAARALVAAVPRGAKQTTFPEAPTAGPVLEAREVSRSYPLPGRRQVRRAVSGVSLQVRAGEALGIVGESGSGKSTLARLLLAAEEPDEGEVLLEGRAWSGLPERRRRARRSRLRLVPQDPGGAMDPRRTVGRILRDAGAPPGEVPALLQRVHLETDVAQRNPRTLSGGQRQRVAIARALASRPDVLVLDEPVSALDVQVQAGILALLGELQARGVTLVVISHDLAVVRLVCDRVAVMSEGRVVEVGRVEDVWAHPRSEVTRALLAAAPSLPEPRM